MSSDLYLVQARLISILKVLKKNFPSVEYTRLHRENTLLLIVVMATANDAHFRVVRIVAALIMAVEVVNDDFKEDKIKYYEYRN